LSQGAPAAAAVHVIVSRSARVLTRIGRAVD
jgi:hypothetical protein